jgi:hypothetical protein
MKNEVLGALGQSEHEVSEVDGIRYPIMYNTTTFSCNNCDAVGHYKLDGKVIDPRGCSSGLAWIELVWSTPYCTGVKS